VIEGMKALVIEQLAVRELAHIFNESDFNYYKRKAGKGGHKWLTALTIVDMFILNAPAR
jgi:hypothetical protein